MSENFEHLRVWLPRITATCGKRSPAVVAVAMQLQCTGPNTIAQLAAMFNRDRRWAMRTVALGRAIGLFTRNVGAHNLQRFALVTTPPPATLQPQSGVGSWLSGTEDDLA